MILSDKDLRKRHKRAALLIPFDPQALQPCSIDLHLGPHIRRFTADPLQSSVIDPYAAQPTTLATTPILIDEQQGSKLQPGEFLLGHTYEQVCIPHDLLGRLEGKSSIGRLGLFVHVTAGLLDPGFRGSITLELYNAAPVAIVLRQGMPIAQLTYEQLTSTVQRPYGTKGLNSHYQDQIGPVSARL